MSSSSAAPTPSSSRTRCDISLTPPSQKDSDDKHTQTMDRPQPAPASASLSAGQSFEPTSLVTRASSIKGKQRWINDQPNEGPNYRLDHPKLEPTNSQSAEPQPHSQLSSTHHQRATIAFNHHARVEPQSGARLSAPPGAHTNPSSSVLPEWPPDEPSPHLDRQPTGLSFIIPEVKHPHATPRQHTQLFSITSGHEPNGAVSAGGIETRGMTTGGGAGTNWTTRSWKASTIGGYDKKRLQALGFEEELSKQTWSNAMAQLVACSLALRFSNCFGWADGLGRTLLQRGTMISSPALESVCATLESSTGSSVDYSPRSKLEGAGKH